MSTSTHLVPLTKAWTLWKWFRLRGAGFPSAHVLELSAPRARDAHDAWVAAERECARVRTRAIATLESRIASADERTRKRSLTLLRKLRRGKLPALTGEDELPELRDAVEALLNAKATATKRYEEDDHALRARIRAFAADERFRKAVAWQNLAAWQLALPRVASAKGAKKLRRAEQMVASYVQRYHVKNDTIGFFGPQGDGLLTSAQRWHAKPGKSFLASRSVCFEHWAIAALADSLAQSEDVARYAFPRRLSSVRLEGTTLVLATGEVEVDDSTAAVLAKCDGKTTAESIATAVAGARDDLEAEEVYEVLESLVEGDIITWSFPLQTASRTPEVDLASMLAKVPGEAGSQASEKLRELVRAKEAVAAASGHASSLAKSLEALAKTFERLTHRSATRNHGKTYGSRTLVYEECRRNHELALGSELLEVLAEPLALVLQSARWFTHRIAECYREELRRDFLALAPPEAEVDFLAFWERAGLRFGSDDAPSALVHKAQTGLREHWRSALGLEAESDASRRSYTSEKLVESFATLFDAPGPGWPSARYHSPDILLRMNKAGDFDSGLRDIVLGEVHAAMNTCGIRVFQDTHAERDALIAARQADLPLPAVVHVIASEQASRADHVWSAPHNVDLELGATPSWRPPEQVIEASELVVGLTNDTLYVRTRDDRWRFDIIQVVENFLVAEASGAFSYLPKLAHRPRITIDSVIVGRETWVFAPSEMGFHTLPRGPELYTAARRWADAHALPERVFLKVPEETKPMYIDLTSPIYIELAARLVAKASSVTISEILPDTSEAWLRDHKGQAQSAELRFAAVDPLSWSPPNG